MTHVKIIKLPYKLDTAMRSGYQMEIRNAHVVIDVHGTVVKDRHGEVPRAATTDELVQAVRLARR